MLHELSRIAYRLGIEKFIVLFKIEASLNAVVITRKHLITYLSEDDRRIRCTYTREAINKYPLKLPF